MTDNFVQLNKSDVLTLKIKRDTGEYTGEELVFDLEDVELPLRYQELLEQDKKNKEWLRNQFLIIDKKQDVKGKKLLTKNQEEQIKAINEFFKRETEVYNMFLGENGVQKLLDGRKFGWTTLDEIDEIIEKQIVPYVTVDFDRVRDKIKFKYQNAIDKTNKAKEVLK